MTLLNTLKQKDYKAVTESDVRIVIGGLIKYYKTNGVDVTDFDPFECGCINGKVILTKDLQTISVRFYKLLNLNLPTITEESKIATIRCLKLMYYRLKRLI